MALHLPYGIDEFPTVRAEPGRYLYVDKTERIAALAAQLLQVPHVLLARPRRFGKTLLLSTLESLFKGEKRLFAGTWLGQEGHWDWPRHTYPVLRLDMSVHHDPARAGIESHLASHLRAAARAFNADLDETLSPVVLLEQLIAAAHAAAGKPVVLIDEYDAPITDALERSASRENVLHLMKSFYRVLKRQGRFIQCVLMVGVTRFARAGLFAGANQFLDLTFDPQCNALLGFTEDELQQDAGLAREIALCARNLGCSERALRGALRDYYNGYQFSPKEEAVYNPFSLSACFRELRAPDTPWSLQTLPNAWSDSGTPSLLFHLWQSGDYVAQFHAQGQDALSFLREADYALTRPNINVLMYHAGYFTLRRTAQGFQVVFPNKEVELTFRQSLERWRDDEIEGWHIKEKAAGRRGASALRNALRANDKEAVRASLDDFLQRFPYLVHSLPPSVKNVYDYELHYRYSVYAALMALEMPAMAEVPTARGRIDILIQEADRIMILEFKANATAVEALRQVWDRGYADPYRATGLPVTACGLNFDTHNRTIRDVAVHALGTYDAQRQRWRNEPMKACTLTDLSRMPAAERAPIVAAWNPGA